LVSCKKEQNSIPSSNANSQSVEQSNSGYVDNTAKISSVVIGTQCWMAKNLEVCRYRNGDKIPYVANAKKWSTLTTGAWCWPNNDSVLGAVYGKIYNWYAVNDPRGLAPAGWHVPSDDEWATMVNYLGGAAVAGGKLKETGTEHWLSPNADATNSTGYTGLPAGNRYNNGQFLYLNMYCWCWTTTLENGLPVYRRLNYYDGSVFRGAGNTDMRDGFPIRCIKDN
jgi:uncharacterized protein (TIGR02145 family)